MGKIIGGDRRQETGKSEGNGVGQNSWVLYLIVFVTFILIQVNKIGAL